MKSTWLPITCALFTGGLSSLLGAEYIPGSGWREFTFSNLNQHEIFNDQEPFTFTVRAEQQPMLEVADLDDGTERYSVYSNGQQISFASPDGRLAPGSYSIKFRLGQWWVYSPKPIRGQFRVKTLPGPIFPATTPKEQFGCIGREVSFRATARAADSDTDPLPFEYLWLFNGTNVLAGETNSRLNLINLTVANEGFYSCIISNQFGSITSPPSFLRVLDACAGLHLYAGLSITGVVGRTYFVDYVTSATDTNWTSYATNTLAGPVWLFVDTNTPAEPKKFFRVRLKPEE